MKTIVTIDFRPAYFNVVCYANIPAGWIIRNQHGDHIADGATESEAVAYATAQGWTVSS